MARPHANTDVLPETIRRPALLVVDTFRAYFDRSGVLGDAGAPAVAEAERVLSAARATGVPIIHTGLQFRPDGLDGGHYFRRNPDLAMFAGAAPERSPAMAPTETELLVARSYPSAFFGTSLAATLRGAAVDSVVIVGAMTSGSIRVTAIDALQHGFVPVVVAGAVADASPDAHDASLCDLAARYAEVCAAGLVLDRLAQVALVSG